MFANLRMDEYIMNMAKDAPESTTELTVNWHRSIGEISRDEWNSLALPLQTPFLEWDWLNQLEVSGSIAAGNGWIPVHLTVRHDNHLVAAAPLYAKTHSMGEFVFDFAWADVAEQLGLHYYPKLVGMSPATPSVGYRFLVAPGYRESELTVTMLDLIDQFCRSNNLNGTSFLFPDSRWATGIEQAGYTAWHHQSYLWTNPGFETFDDYLAGFTKNQRRNIRRERESITEAGITLRCVRGEDAPRHWFSLMYDFYEKTNDQFGPWAAKYLDRPFFEGLAEVYRNRILFIGGFESGASDPMAMSFLVYKDDHLVGRYWGTQRYVENLHFCACYYEPIEWAIANGIRTFDPGAGSPHKIRRGFRAVRNVSLHRFADPRMRAIMESNIARINAHEARQIDELNAMLPLKESAERTL